MSHHPSSAELAAFRRTIPPMSNEHDPFHAPTDGGAWNDERENGIGHVPYTDHAWEWDHGSYGASLMRRETSAMRSRAFIAHTSDHAFPSERLFGCPPWAMTAWAYDICA